MPGGGGGAAPSGSSGTGTGQNANVYTPMQQPAVDSWLTTQLGNLFNATNQQTPGQLAWPQVQQAAQGLYANPYAQQAQGGANQAANISGALDPTLAQFGGALAGNAIGIGGYAQPLQDLGFNPIYGGALNNLQGAPNYLPLVDQTNAGAQQAAGIGTQGAAQGAANANTISSTIPWFENVAQQSAGPIGQTQQLGNLTALYAPQVAALAPQVAAPMQGLQQAGQSVWNTAQDPQNALYNRTLNQVEQQQNVANAQAGIAATPYGASVAGDATRNFNIDWQNQQLQRQALGAQALGQADTSAAGLGSTAGNLLTGAGALNQGAAGIYDTAAQIGSRSATTNALTGQTAQTALGLNQGAAGLAQSASAAPQQAYLNNLNAQLDVANQGLQAGLQGSQGIENLLGAQGNVIGQGQGITNNAIQSLQAGQQAPYNTSTQQASNALTGLGNFINYGNQQYTLPQQVINDAESYLGLGQSASGLSGQLGQLGVNQSNQAFQGIGQAAGLGSNLLLGNQGLTGALGLNSQTGLLGGLGGGSAGGLTGIGAESAGIGQFSGDLGFGGGAGTFASAGTGAADAAGGSSILDFLPAVAGS